MNEPAIKWRAPLCSKVQQQQQQQRIQVGDEERVTAKLERRLSGLEIKQRKEYETEKGGRDKRNLAFVIWLMVLFFLMYIKCLVVMVTRV